MTYQPYSWDARRVDPAGALKNLREVDLILAVVYHDLLGFGPSELGPSREHVKDAHVAVRAAIEVLSP